MKKNKILIAEDDYFLRKCLASFLGEEAAHLDTAENGEVAIEKISNNEYQLILLDINMPKKNGFDVLREMEKMNIKTPALVFSAFSEEESKEMALSLGAKEYFVKNDLDVAHLRGIVHTYLLAYGKRD